MGGDARLFAHFLRKFPAGPALAGTRQGGVALAGRFWQISAGRCARNAAGAGATVLIFGELNERSDLPRTVTVRPAKP